MPINVSLITYISNGTLNLQQGYSTKITMEITVSPLMGTMMVVKLITALNSSVETVGKLSNPVVTVGSNYDWTNHPPANVSIIGQSASNEVINKY